MAAESGLVLVDKPTDWTSHDVVARVRRLAGTRRVGHAGTLDPMATGLLVLGVERATRLLTYVVGADKDYDATVRLGVTTTTDDAGGEVLARVGAGNVDPSAIDAAVRALTGPILQVPSAVSAIKVDGRRAYARVRAGEEVRLEPRPVTVDRFDVVDRRERLADGATVVDLDVRVRVSSGTYVRALARDLGAALGVGGHLTSLRRTRVGGYRVTGARTVEQLTEELAVLPMAEAARAIFPARELDQEQAEHLRHGRRVEPAGEGGTRDAPVAAFAPDGTLVALVADDGGATRPVLVLAPA
ncbi:tRNA pseudouridine(55) synthase TruB [Cellulomonas sp. APG4]|uniref:tRNA pseudouridine(55) synthase TruB n=1 Tax=Cellulomonas sp. APG4 TaxID=1538656 RepID=UPI001379C7C5|nr:tRNA pseudouridine(55) synthase TruB [Cellulomonas sp. APG4]NCT92018.1 tRNA pseudouridine(55) synthase TruB [Cellulomonas sp. APG4]